MNETPEINFQTPKNYGVIDAKLTDDQLEKVWALLKKYSHESAIWEGNNLVNVDEDHKQWEITDADHYFEDNILRPVVNSYVQKWGLPIRIQHTHEHGLVFSRLWCRASTRHDYQSLHDHQSVLTFVLWMNIPFNSKIERSIQAGFRPEAGDVVLEYHNTCGQLEKMSWHISKECSGQMILFPSNWQHVVYPHHSTDEYRIAIAGDIALDSTQVIKSVNDQAHPNAPRKINENI
tara:strand:+ start:14 stop:715 length:702 start_codon:yes stop_codon:yes gene_type:complete